MKASYQSIATHLRKVTAMMSRNEGLALNDTVLDVEVSELKEAYVHLLAAIDNGQLDIARHLLLVIDGLQANHSGLSVAAQEAFDLLALAASTEDVSGVRAALTTFRRVLRSQSSVPPRSTVRATTLSRDERSDDSRASGVMPILRREEFDIEAFDQELPETASLFSVDREW
jgi:hypothetical protein